MSTTLAPQVSNNQGRKATTSAGGPFYRPDIDGLRAVAVLIVVFCHANFMGFAGGYIGVDVFFVISGFVVATSILRSMEVGEFTLSRFYLRRARRLMPALMLTLVSVFAFALLFRIPSDAYDVAKSIGFIAILASNIHFSKGWSYFATQAQDQPLLHTWSLSVEEQFYLLLPVLLIVLLRRGRAFAGSVLFGLALASLCVSELNVRHATAGAYYLFQNRAFELLIGLLLALWMDGRTQTRQNHPICDLGLLLGLAGIGYGVVTYSESTRFPGLHALLPCLSSALVLAMGARTKYTRIVLENRAAIAIGRLSYSLYLWHWPVLFAFRTFGEIDSRSKFIAIAIALALSSATYLVVERPLRYKPMPNKRAVMVFVATPLLFAGSVVAVGKTTNEFLFAYPNAVKHDYQLAGKGVFDLPSAKACWNKIEVTDASRCSVGAINSSVKGVLWGDSHSYQMIDFFDRLGKDYGISVHSMGLPACPPIENMPAHPGDGAIEIWHQQCVRHDKAVMSYLLAHPEVKVVFMAAVWQLYANSDRSAHPAPQLHGFMPGEIDNALADTIAKLRAAGKRVVLVNDEPTIPKALIDCEFYNNTWFAVSRRECTYDRQIATQEHAPAHEIIKKLVQKFADVSVIHTYDVPCDAARCKMDIDGVPLYHYGDDGHLGLGGSAVYYSAYVKKHPTELPSLFGSVGAGSAGRSANSRPRQPISSTPMHG